MSISEKISQDIREAMRGRDRERVNALRMISAALKNAEIDRGQPLDKDEEQAVLRRQLKQREESAEAYQKAGREQQAGKEAAEAAVIRGYLPEPLSREEMEQIVEKAIEETGATNMREMGAVMGRAAALSGGRAEGRELAGLVRGRLGGA